MEIKSVTILQETDQAGLFISGSAAGFYTVGLYDETSRNDQEAIAGLADCYVREIQSVPTQDCT